MSVDVENLFRQFTISEVKDVERQIKNDIEKKKEDLRQMVGRRYQDIIEAADNINAMRDLSRDVLNSIRSVQVSLSQESFRPIGHATYTNHSYSFHEKSIKSKLALLKLLSDIPSLIWTSLDENQCLNAAFLFTLGDYVHKTLCTHSLEDREKKLMEAYWSLISGQLREICKHSSDVLKDTDVESYDLILNSVCSLIVVRNLQIQQALDYFLDIREGSLASIFENPDSSSRAQICSALHLITNTVRLMNRLFASHSGDENYSTVDHKVSSLKEHCICCCFQNYLSSQSSVFLKLLPEEAKNFKINLERTVLNPDDLKSSCHNFVSKSTILCQKKLKEYLPFFVSIDSLHTLKSSAIETIIGASSVHLLSNEQLWERVFSSLMEMRLQELAIDLFQANFTKFKESCARSSTEFRLQNTNSNFVFESEENYCEFNNLSIKYQRRDLPIYLKSIGIPLYLCGIVSAFDDSLSKLLSQMTGFLSVGLFQKDSDCRAMYPNVCSFVIENLKRYVQSLSEELQSNEDDYSKSIMYAKIYVAVAELCPSLKNLIDLSGDRWLNFADFLKLNVISLYNNFIRKLLSGLSNEHFTIPDQKLWITNINEWEVVTSEEELEDGRKITSSINIPLSLSKNLFQFFFQVCHKLSSVGVHSMPIETIYILNDNLFARICQFYRLLLDSLMENKLALTQKQNLQIIFDLKFVDSFFNCRRDSSDDIEQLLADFEANMDPFELETVRSFLTKNVVKLLQKLQVTMGCLITPEMNQQLQRHFAVLKNDQQHHVSLNHLERHQIFAFNQVDFSQRFHLLPISEEDRTLLNDSTKSLDDNTAKSVVAKSRKDRATTEFDGKIASVSSFSSLYGKVSSTLFGN